MDFFYEDGPEGTSAKSTAQRIITYDEFGFEEVVEQAQEDRHPSQEEAAPALPHVPMREQFPEAGSDYLGGQSDGWEYRTVFTGSNLNYTYDMIRGFLREEGYGDVPLPETAEELRLFRRPRGQVQLFAEQGYVHNPIKILFPKKPLQRGTLILCIYNEKAEKHLLRFHDIIT